MRGDKSAAATCLIIAAEIAYTPFKTSVFPLAKIEKAALDTLDELGFEEDIEVYGHVLGRIPKKRIHYLFFTKIKNILFINNKSSKVIKEFNIALLNEIRDSTNTWGAEIDGYEEAAD